MRTRMLAIGSSVLAVALATAGLAAGGSARTQADEIVIGASIPLSGPLAGFGSFQK